jgi:hypothetical protein
MIGFFRRPWTGLMPLLIASVYGLPGQCIPQWIEIATTKDEGSIMIDYNSLRRDGQRVGFTLSKVNRTSDDSKVLFFWIDCDRWLGLPEGESEWTRISAESILDLSGRYACTKSRPNLPQSLNFKNKSESSTGRTTFWTKLLPVSSQVNLEIDLSSVEKKPPKIEYPARLTLDGITTEGRFQFDCIKWEMNLKDVTSEWAGWSSVPKSSPAEPMLLKTCNGISQPLWSLVAQSPKGLLWINEKSFEQSVDSYSWNGTLEANGQVPGLPLKLYLQCNKLAFN